MSQSQSQSQTTDKNSTLGEKTRSSLSRVTDSLPEMDKKKTLAAAAGVAVAAAGVAAVRKYRSRPADSEPKIFEVTPNGDGWKVIAGEADEPASTFETKREALDAARKMAHDDVPSRLVVHRQDGTIQDTFTYEA